MHGTSIVTVPMRWLIVGFRLLICATVLNLAAIGVGWPFLLEANANHARISCWNNVFGQAVAAPPPPQPQLLAEARRCAHYHPPKGSP